MVDAGESKFRPRARLLQLLGDQLIGSPRLAVFELVKNAYDADASQVEIEFHDLDNANARIIVRDNGEGMNLETIEKVWLEPGADFREQQRKDNKRSKNHKRLPLGEKGVGRFAVHKLGTQIELRTKRENESEQKVKIDWDSYASHRYMDQAPVAISKSSDPEFTGSASGTLITISGLRYRWKRGDIRRLWRNVKSISSPTQKNDKFSSPTKGTDNFGVTLSVPGNQDWLAGLLDIPDFLNRAMWKFVFLYEEGDFEWSYTFTPLPGINVEGREISSKAGSKLKLSRPDQSLFARENEKGELKRLVVADAQLTKVDMSIDGFEQIGPVFGEFNGFDRDKDVLEFTTEAKSLEEFLDENGGVRVFRDGVRVYNYGERATGDDWLGLDQRRVNIPTRRISNNIILGTVDISLQASGHPEYGLIEKTNREGFIESDALEKFRAIVLAALIEFENLRQEDKTRIKSVLKTPSEKVISDLTDPINALRSEFDKRELQEPLGKYLKAIERKFSDMKEVMTHSGNAGLNLGILFHEIDRGVKGLTNEIRRKAPAESLLKQAEHLSELLDGFSTLLRKDKKKIQPIKSLLRESNFLNQNRYLAHDVVFSCPLLVDEQQDFEANYSFGMMLGALSNLIDNAIYWLQVKWPDNPENKTKRAIYIGTTDYFEEGPAIVIADNGPGLPLDGESLLKPFVTMKPDGMGLGLYYVGLVCELNGARLIVSPEREDVGIPTAYDGAAFAIVFNKAY